MQSYHKQFFEKYKKQKAELAELRQKSRNKRDREATATGSNLTQQKLSFGGGGSKVQV